MLHLRSQIMDRVLHLFRQSPDIPITDEFRGDVIRSGDLPSIVAEEVDDTPDPWSKDAKGGTITQHQFRFRLVVLATSRRERDRLSAQIALVMSDTLTLAGGDVLELDAETVAFETGNPEHTERVIFAATHPYVVDYQVSPGDLERVAKG